jgi:hypothetical protein
MYLQKYTQKPHLKLISLIIYGKIVEIRTTDRALQTHFYSQSQFIHQKIFPFFLFNGKLKYISIVLEVSKNRILTIFIVYF